MPPAHTPHIPYETFTSLAPHARPALVSLGKPAADPPLDPALVELVKLRVSQLNGCAFCLQIHLDIARRLAVPAIKLDLLAAWRDSGQFSPAEAAALSWAEHLTTLPSGPPPDAAYAALREYFSESQVAHLSLAIATINAWNRLGAGLRFAPNPAPSPAPAA